MFFGARLITFFFVFSLQASEVIYLGDSHSTGTVLGQRLNDFLADPHGQGCSKAAAGRNDVVKLTGVGLDPKHWLSSRDGGKNYLYRQLTPKNFLSRTAAGATPLSELIKMRGQSRPDRKLVLEFGDNSIGDANPEISFVGNITKMRDQLNVSYDNCVVVAPQPNIQASMREGKKKVLAAMKKIEEQRICQVVYYDQSQSGPLALSDGIHLTPSGYRAWADQAIAGICRSRLFAPRQTAELVMPCFFESGDGAPMREASVREIFGPILKGLGSSEI
jgi:hypothetical protein